MCLYTRFPVLGKGSLKLRVAFLFPAVYVCTYKHNMGYLPHPLATPKFQCLACNVQMYQYCCLKTRLHNSFPFLPSLV